jgi:hypothetical protein
MLRKKRNELVVLDYNKKNFPTAIKHEESGRRIERYVENFECRARKKERNLL